MITEDDLRQHYAAITVAPESEQRVIAAVLEPAAGTPRRTVVLASVLASAAVVVAAIVLVAIRSAHSSVPTGQAATAVVPPARPGTIVGVVLDNGRPLAGATVAAASAPDQPGQTIIATVFARVSTDARGSFVIVLPHKPFAAVELTAAASDGRSGGWRISVSTTSAGQAGHRSVVDLGRHTVSVDGKSSYLPVTSSPAEVTGTLQLVGGPAQAQPRGVPGVVYAYRSSTLTGPPVWTGKAAERGQFTATLPAGTYYFAGKSPQYQNGASLCRSGTVSVAVGSTATVQVDCQAR